MAIRIDREIQRILMTQYDRAMTILEENRDGLEALTDGLMEFETLDSQEILALIDGVDRAELAKRRLAREPTPVASSDEDTVQAVEDKPTSHSTPSIVPLKPGDEKT